MPITAIVTRDITPGTPLAADACAAYLEEGRGCLRIETPDPWLDAFANHWLPRQVYYHGDVNRLTTDPQWTQSRWAGDVDNFTLENVVIDNYFFGVAAVAKDGTESPVVFPGAAGSFGGY